MTGTRSTSPISDKEIIMTDPNSEGNLGKDSELSLAKLPARDQERLPEGFFDEGATDVTNPNIERRHLLVNWHRNNPRR